MNLLKLANPIAVTKGAFGVAGTAVGLVDTMARGTAHLGLRVLQRLGDSGEQSAEAQPFDGTDTTDLVTPTRAAAPDPAPDPAVADVELRSTGPAPVPVEPHPPVEPPIDVVGQALAAEAALGDGEIPDGVGLAHEPRGASRDEEHGDAPLQRAEAEGIDDEVTAALEGDFEPEEEDVSGPLLDPGDVKAVAADMRTSARAADPRKG
jgi:hypothetical protein